MKDIEEFAKNTLFVMCCMAVGWAVCFVGLGVMWVL